MICSYCETETSNTKICDFCKADLTKPRPKLQKMEFLNIINYTKPELDKLHTYNLLLTLKAIRAERSDVYEGMQIIRKALDKTNNKDHEDLRDEEIRKYREITARKNVVEQILVDRLGYFPKRIHDKFLKNVMNDILKSNKN